MPTNPKPRLRVTRPCDWNAPPTSGSTENAKRFHNPLLRDAAGAQIYVSNEWTTEKINARYTWLFEYNAATVSIDPV